MQAHHPTSQRDDTNTKSDPHSGLYKQAISLHSQVRDKTLKLTETLDISTRMMARAGHILHGEELIDDQAIHSYWAYSRDLANQWLQNMSVCQKVLSQGDPIRSRQCWLEYEPDFQEILRADILHRTWYTILKATDTIKDVCHCEPIGRSVLTHQMQVKTRVLKLILSGYQFDAARMSRLNEIRKSTEAWSDLVCSHLAIRYQVKGIIFDHERAHRWGKQPLEVLLPKLKLPVSAVRQTDLLWNVISTSPDSHSLNTLQRLVRTMLDCFPRAAFDRDGTLLPVKS